VTLSFAFSIWLLGSDSSAAFYSPLSRFWELGLGGLLACRWVENKPIFAHRWIAEVVALVGLILIVLAVSMLAPESKFPGWWALLPVVGSALVISAGSQTLLSTYFLSLRPMVAIGLISYPLYLWHWPLLTFLRIHESGDPSSLEVAATVSLSLVFAWMTYYFVEKPIRFGLGVSARFRVVSVSVLLVVACAVGLTVHARDGFASRFPGQIQALAKFKYDPSGPYREHDCFLAASDPASALKACADGEAVSGQPVVLLWGDSYAAALYPGYKKVLAGRARLLQVTAVGCPPALNFKSGGKRCADIDAEVMRRIRSEHVERVVIAANWPGQHWPGISKQVAEAIEELRRNGVRKIDMVGQLPEWPKTLPVTVFDAYKRDGKIHQHLSNELVDNRSAMEDGMRLFARQQGVRYISPTSVFCSRQGCLTMIGGRLDQLTSFDRGHLTVPASEFLVERFPQ